MKKFIIGWMTYKPGMREEFLAVARMHQDNTRAEPGCEFFDITLSLDQPNVAIVAECFTDEAAHEAHNATPYMAWFRKNMARILSEGRFHNIYSDQIRVDEVKFD
jgi:(4S)-4-hydroxy-5-phosphonooxypentane-2,3-dione isomerase